jgi:hypothetical protein
MQVLEVSNREVLLCVLFLHSFSSRLISDEMQFHAPDKKGECQSIRGGLLHV